MRCFAHCAGDDGVGAIKGCVFVGLVFIGSDWEERVTLDVGFIGY